MPLLSLLDLGRSSPFLSLQKSSYARKNAAPLFSAAQSWKTLHSALAEVGISLRLKGNGLIMVDHTGVVAIKASSVARDFSKAKLEKRFGAFVSHDAKRTIDNPAAPPAEKPVSTYQKPPLAGSDSLYQQYLHEKENAWKERKTQLAAVWDNQKQIMQRIAASAKLNLPKAAAAHLKRKLRLQARASATAAIADIRRSMARKREEIKAHHKPLGYIEWLKREAKRGNVPAIYALRKRGAVAPALINITARDLREAKLIATKIAHVTGRGTLFYRVGQDLFRDNGCHVSLKRDVSDAGIHSALRIAMAKFNGQPLAVNGSDEFKERCVEVAAKERLPITFSSPSMEQKRISRLQQLDIKHDDRMPTDAARSASHESVRLMRKKSSGLAR